MDWKKILEAQKEAQNNKFMNNEEAFLEISYNLMEVLAEIEYEEMEEK